MDSFEINKILGALLFACLCLLSLNIAAHESAGKYVRDIECDVELIANDMLPARVFDGVLFAAGLMGIENGGLCAGAQADPIPHASQGRLPVFFGHPAGWRRARNVRVRRR